MRYHSSFGVSAAGMLLLACHAIPAVADVDDQVQRRVSNQALSRHDTRVPGAVAGSLPSRHDPATVVTSQAPEADEEDVRSIAGAVRAALALDSRLSGASISVQADADNVVTLTGEVGSAAERELAERIAQSTESVAGVRNRLIIREE